MAPVADIPVVRGNRHHLPLMPWPKHMVVYVRRKKRFERVIRLKPPWRARTVPL